MAIITSRANYLISLGDLIHSGERITIPIYNADSVKVPEISRTIVENVDVIRFKTIFRSSEKGKKKISEHELSIPFNIIKNSILYGKIIQIFRQTDFVAPIEKILNREKQVHVICNYGTYRKYKGIAESCSVFQILPEKCRKCEGEGVIIEMCNKCNGTGERVSECRYCDGTGWSIGGYCKNCEGTGWVAYMCSKCDGVGTISISECNECDGIGKIEEELCSTCFGLGKKGQECSHCEGTGVYLKEECKICEGKGFIENQNPNNQELVNKQLEGWLIVPYDDNQQKYDYKTALDQETVSPEEAHNIYDELEKPGKFIYKPKMWADASMRHRVDNQAQYEKLLGDKIINQSPAGTKADIVVLELAKKHSCKFLANDLYKEYRNDYGRDWVKKNRVTCIYDEGEFMILSK